jgi:hypothetical protein
MNSPHAWCDVPLEVFGLVSRFLDFKELISFQMVCKDFDFIASNDKLWEVLLLQKYSRYYPTFKAVINPESTHSFTSSFKNAFVIFYASDRYKCVICLTEECDISFCLKFSSTDYTRDDNYMSACKECRKRLVQIGSLTKYNFSQQELDQLIVFWCWGAKRYDIMQAHCIMDKRDQANTALKNTKFAKRTYSSIARRLKHKREIKAQLKQHIVNKDRFDQFSLTLHNETITTAIKLYECEQAKHDKLSNMLGRPLKDSDVYQLRTSYDPICDNSGEIHKSIVNNERRARSEQRQLKIINKTREELWVRHKVRILPPVCETLLKDYSVDEVIEMMERENNIIRKCYRMGYNYKFLDHSPDYLIAYVRGNNGLPVHEVLYLLISHNMSWNSVVMERIYEKLSGEDKLKLLSRFCDSMKWIDESDTRTDHQQIIAKVQDVISICTPRNEVKSQHSFVQKMIELAHKMVADMIKYIRDHAIMGNVLDNVLLKQFIQLPASSAREKYLIDKARRKLELEKILSKKRERDSNDEEQDDIAYRVKRVKRSVGRFS